MTIKKALSEFWKGQKLFGETISSVVNFILLGIVYILGIGIVSIMSKVFKKSFLEEKIEKESPTYWKDLNLNKKPIEQYYRQF